MLRSLKLTNVGPSPSLAMEFAPRVNLITGDNGLGKSFILDLAWWSLTRTWARGLVRPAHPHGEPAKTATIAATLGEPRGDEYTIDSEFERPHERWAVPLGLRTARELVLYAHVDGGFSCWDPTKINTGPTSASAGVGMTLSNAEVWEGNQRCEGLIRDLASWQRGGVLEFDVLRDVLKALSPSDVAALQPGELQRISANDPKQHPTLKTEYGEDVPAIFASAGIRRILSIAYMIVWAWREHVLTAELHGLPKAVSIVLLIDEVESHLHPKWQQRIVRGILACIEALRNQRTPTIPPPTVQLIASTHSPLVLASIEPVFDSKQDAWFDLDLVANTSGKGASVVLQKRPFMKLGTAERWLMSKAFDLPDEGRAPSIRALIERAESAMDDPKFSKHDALALHHELQKSLGDTDPFWSLWRFTADKRGWILRDNQPTVAKSTRPKPLAKSKAKASSRSSSAKRRVAK